MLLLRAIMAMTSSALLSNIWTFDFTVVHTDLWVLEASGFRSLLALIQWSDSCQGQQVRYES